MSHSHPDLPQPQPFYIPLSRRRLIRSLALLTAGFATGGALAEALTLTPRQTEGPFYPDKLPLDQDNDLIRVTDHLTPATGIITNISGCVLDPTGSPIKGALVELWQADNNGVYLNTRSSGGGGRDENFQGYGRFETASEGGYRFRTIKPGLYTGRTRHYHFGITLPGRDRFTTQLYFADEPGNAKDMVLRGIRDEAQRASVIRAFSPVPDSVELATTWDIVLGLTPQEADHLDEHDHHDAPPPPSAPPAPGFTPRPTGAPGASGTPSEFPPPPRGSNFRERRGPGRDREFRHENPPRPVLI